jgi:hypothetical protein
VVGRGNDWRQRLRGPFEPGAEAETAKTVMEAL